MTLLPEGTYKVILADPPWKFSCGVKSRPQHYPRMTIQEIMALPVKSLVDKGGCRLFLWITAPLLDIGPKVMQAWGFKYCSARVWIKLNNNHVGPAIYSHSFARGTGYEVAGNAEFLLIGKRGKPQSIKGNPWLSHVHAPRREHSRKPCEIRNEIRDRLEGPRLEMFARSSSDGWTTWGNETAKFNEVAA